VPRRALVARIPEPIFDILLPLSLFSLLMERSEDPTGMVLVLVLWLGLRFWLRTLFAPLYWLLLGVLALSVGSLVHPVSVSASGDLLLVLLAFSVGLGRSQAQWRTTFWTLSFIAVAALFIVELDRINDNLNLIPIAALRDALPAEALRLQKVTINRSGYILSLVSICAYGLMRYGTAGRHRWLAAGLTTLSYMLAFGTGSRAAAGMPVTMVLLSEISWRLRARLGAMTNGLVIAVAVSLLMFSVSLYHSASPLASRNPNDAGRAYVAQCFVKQATRSWVFAITGQGGDRVSDRCRREEIPTMPHAHNALLQTWADHGLAAVLVLVTVIMLTLWRALMLVASAEGLLGTVSLNITLFILGSALVESTLLKTSFQQVITGYLLAVSWCRVGSQNG